MRQSVGLFVLVLSLALSARAADKKFQQAAPVRLDHDGEKWATKTLQKLSLEEKVGQLFMVRLQAQFLNVNSPDYLELREELKKYHLGGVLMTVPWDPPFLYRSGPLEAAYLLNQLQQESKLPLLVGADFERGLTMRLRGATEFPHAMAFGAAGAPENAEVFGRITAQEARAVGVQWNFFPDADVNSNPANPIINTRSFGEDPKQVGDLAAAYIRAARENGMLTTAKHFPGHGDTATDSHLGLAQVTGDEKRLESVELPPFRQAIAAGTDAVMIAHVTVPALDTNPNRVATTSPAVVDLLNKLGFHGIVVTDALDMAGLTRLYSSNVGRAAVEAFKAGNDVLLMPADLEASYKAMIQAARSGEISDARLDQSVLKILKAKASVGLERARLVDLNQVPKLVGSPENQAVGLKIAQDAVTLVRQNGLLPLKRSGTVKASLPYQGVTVAGTRVATIIFSDDVRTDAGRTLDKEIRSRVPDENVIYVDANIANAEADRVLKTIDQSENVIAAVYAVPTAGKVVPSANGLTNSVSMADANGSLLQKVLDHAAKKTVVLAMGNPYLAKDFPAIENYVCTFSNASVSDVAAVRALFGEAPIRGHLPVTIPNVAARGAGIERPALVSQGGSHSVAKNVAH